MAKGIFKASFNRRHWFLLVMAGLTLSACSTTPSPWRDDAVNALHAARQESADKHLPTEFESVHIAFSQAELLLQQGKDEEADRFYQLTVIKGRMLHKNVIAKTAQLLHGAGEANRASLERRGSVQFCKPKNRRPWQTKRSFPFARPRQLPGRQARRKRPIARGPDRPFILPSMTGPRRSPSPSPVISSLKELTPLFLPWGGISRDTNSL